MSWAAAPLVCFLIGAESQMTKAERNAQIVVRVQKGEKREMLALEFGINRYTVTRICMQAGIPKWKRFKRGNQ